MLQGTLQFTSKGIKEDSYHTMDVNGGFEIKNKSILGMFCALPHAFNMSVRPQDYIQYVLVRNTKTAFVDNRCL